jgi:hypothetical protein
VKDSMREWASVSSQIRNSVIANLEFDAQDAAEGGGAPFGGSDPDDDDVASARERSNAFRLAAAVLRVVARTHRLPAREAEWLRDRMVDLDTLMDPTSTRVKP